MTTAVLKIKNYRSNINVVDNSDLQHRIFRICIFSVGALCLLYALMLGNMVWNIIERRSLEADIRTLSNEVSNLELTYLGETNKIDLELARSLGFKEVKKTYVSSDTLSSVAILRNDL